MIDPDAPTRDFPSEKYWLHWMITDIKVSLLSALTLPLTNYSHLMKEKKLHEPDCRLRLPDPDN